MIRERVLESLCCMDGWMDGWIWTHLVIISMLLIIIYQKSYSVNTF